MFKVGKQVYSPALTAVTPRAQAYHAKSQRNLRIRLQVSVLLWLCLPLFSSFNVQGAERYIINGVPIENITAEPSTAGVAVATKGAAGALVPEAASQSTPRININTASVDELDQGLAGIGRRKAEAIVEYRTRHGAFSDLRQLMEVKGIGEGILKKNRDRISL